MLQVVLRKGNVAPIVIVQHRIIAMLLMLLLTRASQRFLHRPRLRHLKWIRYVLRQDDRFLLIFAMWR